MDLSEARYYGVFHPTLRSASCGVKIISPFQGLFKRN